MIIRRDSKFIKIEVVMEKDEFKIVSAEVTSNEAESASNTVKDLKRVRKLRGSR